LEASLGGEGTRKYRLRKKKKEWLQRGGREKKKNKGGICIEN